jgi:leucyl aminopeptidase (aminopeptidase T)
VSDMAGAVRTVLVDCLAVEAGENVLVLTDPNKRTIAEALVAGARDLGADAVLAEMSERATHGTEPPRPVAAAMVEAEVLIAPTSKSVSHTEARRVASDRGVRAATMPDVTEDMLVRTMGADYREIRRRSEILAQMLSDASSARITSPEGTALILSLEGRTGLADTGDLTAPGAFGNLPAGEGFVAPAEGETNGRIVFDGSIWPVGILQEPLIVDIEAGYATGFSGAAAAEFKAILEPYGKNAFAVAELGIGTNDAARLTGEVLEDEKILGTVHVAFGDNHSFGGSIRVQSHQDGIVLHPRLEIDGRVVLDEGKLLI